MQPILFIIGFIIDAIGKIILGMAVIFVHGIVLKEKRIDKKVIKKMRSEKTLGLMGILLIIIGSGIQVYFMF